MVVHPSHGGCIIQGLCNRAIRGEMRRYYVLIPNSEPNTTILDPVENVQKIGLHDVISPEQADEILSYASTATVSWIRDSGKRKEQYLSILKNGNLNAMAFMIKELMLHGKSTSLNQNDKAILRNAQKKLLSEIALAKGVDFETALDLMNQAVQPTAQTQPYSQRT